MSAFRSMGFACPSIGSVFRASAPASAGADDEEGRQQQAVPAASQREPSRSRRPLAFLRERGAASIGALRGRKASPAVSSGSGAPAVTAPTAREGVAAAVPASSTAATAGSAPAAASATSSASRGNRDGSLSPPTPPPTTPPQPISIPATSPGTPQGVASRPPPSHRLPVRASQGGLTPPRVPPRLTVGPVDEEGFHDMVLPCGLFQDEVIDFMYRDLKPEDFEALSKLDERVPKRNTARRNLVDRLPRVPSGECGATECGVCLAELEPNTSVVKLPCRHAFHPACINRWLTQCKNTCPLCQAPIQQPIRGAPSAPSTATVGAV